MDQVRIPTSIDYICLTSSSLISLDNTTYNLFRKRFVEYGAHAYRLALLLLVHVMQDALQGTGWRFREQVQLVSRLFVVVLVDCDVLR